MRINKFTQSRFGGTKLAVTICHAYVTKCHLHVKFILSGRQNKQLVYSANYARLTTRTAYASIYNFILSRFGDVRLTVTICHANVTKCHAMVTKCHFHVEIILSHCQHKQLVIKPIMHD